MESPQSFVEEINITEIEFYEVVGKGAFGVVSRGRWRDKDVAVKNIETESERKAFITELKQLSRVSHPNIVKLYGACTKHPVCLVMEYAEGGSLYNVLHGTQYQPNYTAAHAMSWALQCAKGVEYLHGMSPKALIHRDLKPPNLLLIMGGTVLKICDFGTACDIQTHMTNNKGSAAWMAPEVFEGSNYSEKCDVFSWGIILWEVITRRKPFDEIGGPAFRIMWAVHQGKRPPLIKNLPKPLELLMTRCWSGNPVERPSMAEVVRIMSHLFQFFKGADRPLSYQDEGDQSDYNSRSPHNVTQSTFSGSNTVSPPLSHGGTISDTVRQELQKGIPVIVSHEITNKPAVPVVVEEERSNRGQQSAPPSLAASLESLNSPRASRSGTPIQVETTQKRYSADFSKNDDIGIQPNQPFQRGLTHRRIGSDETNRISISTSSSSVPGDGGGPVPHVRTYPGRLNQAGHTPQSPPSRSISYPAQTPEKQPQQIPTRSTSWANRHPTPPPQQQAPGGGNNFNNMMNMVYLSIDHPLQPLSPFLDCPESMAIYKEHCDLMEEYLRERTEMALLMQRRHELVQQLTKAELNQQSSGRVADEYSQLSTENESLMTLHRELKAQVDALRNKRTAVH